MPGSVASGLFPDFFDKNRHLVESLYRFAGDFFEPPFLLAGRSPLSP